MIYSDQKYIDPSAVINSIADDLGKYIQIGALRYNHIDSEEL